MIYKLNPKVNDNTISQISEMHEVVLTDSVLNKFGQKFVYLYYKTLLKNKGSLLIIGIENKKVEAFLIATKDSRCLVFKFITSNIIRLFVIILQTTLSNPKTITSMLINFGNKPVESKTEILSLAVNHKFQGIGHGSKLMDMFEAFCSTNEIRHYQVGTKKHDALANNFYSKQGLIYRGSYTYLGDEFNNYLKIIR